VREPPLLLKFRGNRYEEKGKGKGLRGEAFSSTGSRKKEVERKKGGKEGGSLRAGSYLMHFVGGLRSPPRRGEVNPGRGAKSRKKGKIVITFLREKNSACRVEGNCGRGEGFVPAEKKQRGGRRKGHQGGGACLVT